MSPQSAYSAKRFDNKFLQTEERPWICNNCGKAFKTKAALHQHIRSHSNIRPFSCDICNKSFKQKHHLREHAVSHTDERPWSCDDCGKTYKEKRALRQHIIGTHGPAYDPSVKMTEDRAQLSNGNFRRKPPKNNHRKKRFSGNGLVKEGSFYCDHCGNIFTHKSELQAHIISHHFKERQLIGNVSKTMHHHSYTKIIEGECDEGQNTKKPSLPLIGASIYKSSFWKCMNEKEYFVTCPACRESFSRHHILIEHTKKCEKYADSLRHEMETAPEKCEFECGLCRLPFDEAPCLAKHLANEHNVKLIFHWCIKYGCEKSCKTPH